MFIFSKGLPKIFNPLQLPCVNVGKSEKYGLERRQNFGKNHSMRLYNETVYIKQEKQKYIRIFFPTLVGKKGQDIPHHFPMILQKTIFYLGAMRVILF